MPVSAASSSGTMLYNGVELPDIDSVWTNKVTYPYAFIYQTDPKYGTGYILYTAKSISNNYVNGDAYVSVTNGRFYDSDGTSAWSYINTTSTTITGLSLLVWANFNIYTNSTMTGVYFPATAPVDPNAPTPITGRMLFGSEQIFDDFASFALQAVDLSDSTASISYGYKLYSGGEELRSVMDDEELTGYDSYVLHSTLLNLDPETEYEIIYTLYANGEPTEITASTTFTTLASSGSGGGSDPDYSGQLNGIQQGIGEIQDSVDNVGSKVDDIQDTLTETKEEITSLPGKIASAILDGIKSLFVPSEEDLTEIKDKYESMLSEKLGFVWQAFDLLTTFVGDLQTSLESGEAYEFNFPGVVLPMQGEEFVLVPETAVSLDNGLMDVLRPVLGTVISMIAVIAFVNMAHDYVLAIVSGVSAYQFERRKE